MQPKVKRVLKQSSQQQQRPQLTSKQALVGQITKKQLHILLHDLTKEADEFDNELRISVEEKRTYNDIIKKLQIEKKKNETELGHLSMNRSKLETAISELEDRIKELQIHNRLTTSDIHHSRSDIHGIHKHRQQQHELAKSLKDSTYEHIKMSEELQAIRNQVLRDRLELSKSKGDALHNHKVLEQKVKTSLVHDPIVYYGVMPTRQSTIE
jgi:predicted nuclease with TOPRIM domain